MPRACLSRLMCLFALCLFAWPASAVYEKQDGFPWNMTLKGDYDQPIVDKLGGGFFMNVGPTGIRAQITHEHPAFFTVKFVFDKSPAAGKVKAGDIIIGANGKVMNVAHKFGRRTVSGWDGPMTEMAKLIEDSQAEDGKLELIIWPGGDKSKQKTETIQLDAVGRFSKTFPYNCERSDKLMADLCDFLAFEYERKGSFGRVHTGSASVLALMASGNDKYASIIRKAMSGYANKRYSSMNGGGFPCWGFGHDGVVMGEYYLLTKDKSLLPAMKSLATAWAESQDPTTGGYMHKPYPFITKRIADGGPKGYGSMAGTAGVIFLAHSIFRVAEVEYDEACYERLHQAYLTSVDASGTIGYGFSAWNHAIIEPTGDSAKVLKDARGIGYEIPGGMEGIDDFKVIWPTKADPRFKPIDWIKDEADKVRVFVSSDKTLKVIRDLTKPELKGPLSHNGKRVHHLFRSGTAALGHAIGHQDDSWKYMADHLADSCANSPQSLLDGHASTLMHTLWGSLGASRSKNGFRHYMDGIKWWFIMAQTHDGGFVCMPGRDYASTDHVYGTRNFPTATAALILSVKEAKLQITGADAPHLRPKPTEGEGGADTPDRPKNTRPAASIALLGEDFKVVHCDKEAQMFDSNTPYAKVLYSLDDAFAQGGDRGKEAAEFARRLRGWLTERNQQIIKDANTYPARTLARSRDHLRRLAGYEDFDATAAQAVVENLGKDRDVRTLSRYYEQLDTIAELEAKRGSSDSTIKRREQLVTLTERFMDKPGLAEKLSAEAEALLVELKGEEAAE